MTIEMKLPPRLAYEFNLIKEYLLKDIIPKERKKPDSDKISDEEITFAYMIACNISVIEVREKKI